MDSETERESGEDQDCRYNPKVEHVWKRLPGCTSRGVKLMECILCGAQEQEDYSK